MTQHLKLCPQCKQPTELEATFCIHCGHQFRTRFRQALPPAPQPPVQPTQYYVPPQPQPYQQPYPPPQYPPRQKTEICGVIAAACAGMSLLILPVVLGPAAFILGCVSLYRVHDDPRLRGAGLAYVGIILGVITSAIAAISLLLAYRQV